MRTSSLTWLLLGAFLPLLAGAHGSYHEQLALWEKAQAMRPHDPALWVQRAELDLEHEDWAAALVALEKAERGGAPGQTLLLPRARALAAGKQWRAARLAFDEVLSAQAVSSTVLMERARVLKQVGEPAAALADYLAALKLTTRPEPEQVMEVVTELTVQSKPTEALQTLDQTIASLGPVPALVLSAVDIEVKLGRWEAALKRLDAMQAMPRPEPWMARRASVLAQAGRMQESAAAWRQLRAHVMALPEVERSSHAMSQCLAQTNQALAALASVASREGGARP